jgi:hypothetical protein
MQIKNLTALFIIGCLCISACSHTPERQVQRDETASKNVFISEDDPKITIKPNSDFVYLGDKELFEKDNSNKKDVVKIEQHTYIYISQGRAKKILVIRIYNILEDSYSFSPDMCSFGIKGILSKGTETLGDGNKYGYCIGSMASKYDEIALSLVEKGYLLPACFMVKETGRIYSKKSDKKILITYYEDIDETGFECSDWQWGELTSDKKYFIEGFVKRSKEAFEIASKE